MRDIRSQICRAVYPHLIPPVQKLCACEFVANQKLSMLFAVILLAGANVAVGQPGSTACKNAQKAVAAQEKKIEDFEQTRNSPQYAGSAITVYENELKQMQNQLQALRAGEKLACSATGVGQNGVIFPKYMVLTLIYAPPGNASGKSTSTDASYVDYSTGSTIGSTVDVAHAFKSDYSVTAGLSVGGASVSVGGEWTEQQTTTDEYKVNSSDKSDERIPGPAADGIDHDYDEFILCLNPIINVSVQGNKLIYTPGVDGPSLIPLAVFAYELKNPSNMRHDVAVALQAKDFKTSDYNAILSLDPFANGSTAIDTNRFVRTSTTLPYEPPLTANDLPNINSHTITNDSTSTNSNQNISSSAVTLTASVTYSGGFVSATVSTKDSWTWTQTNSTAKSTGSNSSATVAIGDPSYGYSGDISDIAGLLGYDLQHVHVCSGHRWPTLLHRHSVRPQPQAISRSKSSSHHARPDLPDLYRQKWPIQIFWVVVSSQGGRYPDRWNDQADHPGRSRADET